jgi:alpha-tubulin suppressor-like RCC1 family protein
MTRQAGLCMALLLSLVASDALAQTKVWGNNYQGQLGDGFRGFTDPTHINNPTPITLGGLADVISLSGGDGHTLAARSDGTVMTWGPSGQPSSLTPVPVSILTNVIAVSAGVGHSLALKSDGTVWAWGNNGNGELGDYGSENFSAVPVQVGGGSFGATTPGFDSIIAIEAGLGHSLALKADGTVWVWGANGDGQLGNGDMNRLSAFHPLQLGLTNIIAIGGGDQHSIALRSDGTLWGWGQNGAGQLGNGTITGPFAGTFYLSPVQNPLISGITQIAVAERGTLALKTDGTVWAWGYNEFGITGNGTRTTANQCQCESTPTQATITNVTALQANGSNHHLARKRDGSIWAWGYNAEGEGGTGAVSPQTPDHYSLLTPTQSIVGTGNVIFGTGRAHSMLSVPTVPVAAGANQVAQLGEATVTFASVTTPGNVTITAIDPGTIALPPPASYTILLTAQSYDIATTATFTNATVCIKVPMVFDHTIFNSLRILHVEGGALVARTTSLNYLRREVCGVVPSLSPLVIATSTIAFPPVLSATSSRRAHGAAGTFDLPLSAVATNPTTEPRQGPAQAVVFTYDKPIASATASITEGTAVAAAPTFTGNDVVVSLTGVVNAQYVTVGLSGVVAADGGVGGVVSTRVGFLLGDVNQSRVVSLADLGLVNAQLSQPVAAANFLKDVNASGTVTLADKGLTNAVLTTSLPPP